MSSPTQHTSTLINTGDKLVGDDLAILDPIIPVFSSTLFEISPTSMGQHGQKEDGVEHRDDRVESGSHAPSEGLDPVGGVVDLSGVYPPSIDEQFVAVFGLDVFRVLDERSGDDGKGVSRLRVSLLLEFKVGFLGHGTVENAVSTDEGDEHERFAPEWEFVGRKG